MTNFDLSTPAGQVNIALIIFGAILVLIGASRGAGRRFGRSVLRLISIAASAWGAYFICRQVTKNISQYIENPSVQSALESVGAKETVAKIETMFPDLIELIGGIPLSIAMPVIFIVVFFILSIVMLIPYGILAVCIFPKGKHPVKIPGSGLLGFIVGAVQGAAVALIWVLPIVGLFGLVNTAADRLTPALQDNTAYVETVNQIKLYGEPLSNHEFVKIPNDMIGKKLFTKLTTFEYKDKDISVEKEVGAYAQIVADAIPLNGINLDNITEEQLNSIDKLADDLAYTDTGRIIISRVVAKACETWLADTDFFGIARPTSENEALRRIIDSSLETFKNSTPETIADDIRSLVDALRVMVKYDVLKNMANGGNVSDILSNPEMMSELITALESSENIKTIAVEVAKIGIDAVINSVNAPEDVNQACQDMAETLATKLNTLTGETPEEKKENLTQDLKNTLNEVGVSETDVAPELIDFAAEFIYDEFVNGETVTAESILAYLGMEGVSVPSGD